MKKLSTLILSTLLFLLTACGGGGMPDIPGLPQEPADIPGLGDIPGLEQIPGLVRDLGLPDLSNIPGLPQLSDLPQLATGPNAVAFAGPTERRVVIGETIPGTDIQLSSIGENGAEFQIAGLRSVRTTGDSLDYDGGFVGIDGINYTLRLRIYRIGSDSIRVAGVHQLVVENIQPTAQSVSMNGTVLRIPYTGSAGVGETFKGLTYGYAGQAERGGELTGLPEGEFPFRKLGDSVRWEGTLRPDIPIRYELRVLFFNDGSMQTGGVATLRLPNQ